MKLKDIMPYWREKGLWLMFFCAIVLVILIAYIISDILNYDEDLIYTSIIGGLISGSILIIFDGLLIRGFGVKVVQDQVNLQNTIRKEIDSHETKMRIKEAIRTVLDERNIKGKI